MVDHLVVVSEKDLFILARTGVLSELVLSLDELSASIEVVFTRFLV